MDGCEGKHKVCGVGASADRSRDAAWGNREVDGAWGDGHSMSRETCLELRQSYAGQTDAEREMEGEEVFAQLQGVA